MQSRWRAKICPECGKYFVATKTAQSYCSARCYEEMKRKRALDYWRETGSVNRDERLKHKTESSRRKKE